jgi:membrane-associated protein
MAPTDETDAATRGQAPALDGEPTRRRVLAWAVCLAVVGLALIGLTSLLPVWDDVAGAGSGSYALVFLTIVGDAVFPVLPGETALNAASVAAADGGLVLWLVIVAGSLAAIVGDSCVYWIARSVHGPWHDRLMKAAQHPRATAFLTVFADRAPLMIVFGRYVPGVRLVVNVTMGSVVRLPYPRFLLWSAVAGTSWSAYTCVLAYLVASALSSAPLASILISGLITTAAIAVLAASIRRGMRTARRVAA